MKMPNSVCWNITKQCNDNCLFCYRDQISENLSFNSRKSIIEKIALSGIRKITFAGGEPLLVPEIQELINYSNNLELTVSMSTNGILLKGELLDFCLENLDWLTLSLDGASDTIQKEMTRNSGHLKRVLDILDYAVQYKKRKCKLKINTVVSHVNKENILEIADVIASRSVNRWKLFQFVPLRGNAVVHNEKFAITDAEFNQVVTQTRKFLKNEKVLLSISGRENIESAYFVIFPNGDIKISTDLKDIVLGNALTDDLKQIWIKGNYYRELHEERTKCVVHAKRETIN